MVRRFVQTVSEQAVGVGVIRGVRPDQQLVKVSQMLLFSRSFRLIVLQELHRSVYCVMI